MIIPTHVRVAMENLRSTRVRTSLTTLGIIIGVLSVTLVMALGEGAKRSLVDQITGLDSGIIIAKPGGVEQRSAFSAYTPFSVSSASTLTERDVRSIVELQDTSVVAPIMFVNGTIKYKEKTSRGTPIIATSPDFVTLMKLDLASGQFISESTNRDTIVLGYSTALELIGTDQARGQEVVLKGRPHTVIGVLKATRAPINAVGVNLDRSAFVSLDDGKSFNQGIAQISQVILQASDPYQTPTVASTIDELLLKNHDGERDFSVIEGKDAAQTADAFYDIMVFITAAVAAVALVVGGIGIMNIMLVTVIERTREIGIRKALGASNGQILWQFLVESLTMTIVGGFIGLFVAYFIAFFVATFFSFQPALTWGIVGTAMGLAVGVGVLFGLYPAIKASRKDPIEALRQYE